MVRITEVKVTIKFRKPGTRIKFKDSELQCGRQMSYRWGDDRQMVGGK